MATSRNPTPITTTQIETLRKYTACDIADALLKLKVPNAGFLADLRPFPAPTNLTTQVPLLIARASTILFVPKNPPTPGNDPRPLETTSYSPSNIPSSSHWVDMTEPDTIAILSQPPGQRNAVLGGIMALRLRSLSARGIIVHGRIRDLPELSQTGLPIWALGTSIVGAGADSKAHAVQVPLNLDGTEVRPGDLVCCDVVNGVVVIPAARVEEVVAMLPGLVAADDKVKEEVEKGMTVQEAFKKHRG